MHGLGTGMQRQIFCKIQTDIFLRFANRLFDISESFFVHNLATHAAKMFDISPPTLKRQGAHRLKHCQVGLQTQAFLCCNLITKGTVDGKSQSRQ